MPNSVTTKVPLICFICRLPVDPAGEGFFLGYGCILGLGSGVYHEHCWPDNRRN